MKKFNFIYAAAISMTLGLGFVACGDDEPDSSSIVTPQVPATLGWTNADGVATYTLINDADYTDGEVNAYFSLANKDNKVTEAVFTIVTEGDATAKALANLIQTGQWINYGDDEASVSVKARRINAPASKLGNRLMTTIMNMKATRASLILPYAVKQEGACIYVNIDALNGKELSLAKNVINYWVGVGNVTPDQFVFGSWDGKNYSCTNMAGLGITYNVATDYNSDDECTKYVTTINCPNSSWATVMKAEMDEQAEGFEEFFGKAPVITLNGNTVTVEAAIVDMMEKEYVVSLLQSLEWINNTPFLYQMTFEKERL